MDHIQPCFPQIFVKLNPCTNFSHHHNVHYWLQYSLVKFLNMGSRYSLSHVSHKCNIFCLIGHIWPPKKIIESLSLSLSSCFHCASNPSYIGHLQLNISYLSIPTIRREGFRVDEFFLLIFATTWAYDHMTLPTNFWCNVNCWVAMLFVVFQFFIEKKHCLLSLSSSLKSTIELKLSFQAFGLSL